MSPPILLCAANLEALPWLVHGFGTRACDLTAPEGEAQARFAAAVTGDPAVRWRWRGLKQIHSDRIWCDPAPQTPGDGQVTRQAGALLAVRVADCVPILLADSEQRAVAAIHAGWRGTATRIAEKAVGELRARFGSRPGDLRAAIGPSIRRCCYQVGESVVEAFASQFAYAAELFTQPAPNPRAERYPMLFLTGAPPGHPTDPRWNYNSSVCLDLAEANRRQLVAAGMAAEAIEVLPYCTSCRADWFFSYRRDGSQAGRQAAAIGVRPA